MGNIVIQVENAKAYYILEDKYVRAIDDVSLSIKEGEVVGIVGESGSGKTTLSNVMLMNIKKPLSLIEGKIKLYANGDVIELNKLSRESTMNNWGNSKCDE
jgi:peptide/nickel transport system ATP-binding protein